jgi:hypothetical protein
MLILLPAVLAMMFDNPGWCTADILNNKRCAEPRQLVLALMDERTDTHPELVSGPETRFWEKQ